MRFSMYLLAAFLFCELLSYVNALKANDSGVCIVRISSRRTRIKSYAVTKMCGKKKCAVRRTKSQPYTVTKDQAVCCKGWEYNSESDACNPHCSTGCEGGTCTAPDTCHCEPPAVLDLEHKNICITPCNPPCFNAECINNTCQCKENYTRYNTTHCHLCEPGSNECLTCVCANGTCVSNTCTCNDGYSMNNGTCTPTCDNCINSYCIAPNTCACFEGYEKSGDVCVPKCDCEHGVCKAPNVCECYDGYVKSNNVCVPVCEPSCSNGHCVAPNTCSCNKGYVKGAGNTCHKPCPEVCTLCDDHGRCIEEGCLFDK